MALPTMSVDVSWRPNANVPQRLGAARPTLMSLSSTAAAAASRLPLPGLDWRVMLALVATYLSFGSGPAGARAALDGLPPFVLVGIRGVAAGSVLVAWSLATGAPRPGRRQW